mmetsp:Transcript_89796/g.256664  ORF Transcript_89796/g.256664 Transcript_89796/m.256664 type:complete len:153 (-) Transcript_89796:1210-1668(-)
MPLLCLKALRALSNGRYNDNCKCVLDLEKIDSDTKITWATSPKFGPFRARDFCTLVHFRVFDDKRLVVVNQPATHVKAPCSKSFVRSEVILAGTILRPLASDPSKTEILTITAINAGGAADSRAGAMVMNTVATTAPVNFVRRLEASAKSSP